MKPSPSATPEEGGSPRASPSAGTKKTKSAFEWLVIALGLFLVGAILGPAWADGTETLGPPGITIAPGSGTVAAGVGLSSGTPFVQTQTTGTITIDVPGTVKQALLYWEGFMSTDTPGPATLTVNGTSVTGTLIGGPAFFFGGAYSSVYRADITSLGLVGSGLNTLTVTTPGYTNVSNGAGLLVVYDDGSPLVPIGVRDGVDLAFVNFPDPRQGTIAQTFTFPPSSSNRVANLAMFFGSVAGNTSGFGALRPNRIDITVAGVTTALANPLASNDGEEWDSFNFPVGIPPGATELTVQAFSINPFTPANTTDPLPASFTWTAAALSVPPPKGAIGDTVWLDLNNNGIQNFNPATPPVEPGVKGVIVKLFSNPDGDPGCVSGDETILATDVTDSAGKYLFDNLDQGNYCVQFVRPTGYAFTTRNASGSTPENDSDANVVTGRTGNIPLGAAQVDLSWDAGLIFSKVTAIGDRVWEDKNGNGIQDCTDTNGNGILGDVDSSDPDNPAKSDQGPECGKGVPNAKVTLTDCAGNSVSNTLLTDSNGFYLFDNLVPGTYCVKFEPPENFCGPGVNAYFTTPNANGDAADSDANPTTGLTGPITLTAGETNLTVDAGVYCPAKLGDRIWLDKNQNGNQDCSGVDPSNPGQVIPNGGAICTEPTFTAPPVTVSLTDCAGGNALDIAGNAVNPTTTDSGLYLFSNLKPGGKYCVQFTRPAGYNCTTANAAGVGYQVNSDGAQNNGFCTTGPVPLLSGGDDRSWDLGLVLPPPNCNLKVQKTCEVPPPLPSTGPFVCSNAKPLDVLTMINGSGQTVSNIRVYRDKYDPKNPAKNLMYSEPGPFSNGAEVTASGYAAASAVNDVDWVFTANGTTYISRFHRSCSDPDMNGPEDCGKPQGNAKSTSTSLQGLPVLNTWKLEGLAGNGQVLNCTPDPVQPQFPAADSCITTAQNLPDCKTQGKPKELVFKYTVTPPNGPCTISNGQGGKATCSVTGTFDPAQSASVLAAGSSDLNKDRYTVVPTSVNPDGSITVTFNGSDFKADSFFRLSQGNNRVDLKIHTSCSQALAVGDVFGPLTLVGFNGATGGTPVRYGYELKNLGNLVTVSSIVDDKLGLINFSDCGTGLPNLATGASVRCIKEGAVTQTTTNTVTVNATLTNGASCPATASLTVTVAPPPPPVALCDALKPIDALVLEFDQSAAGGRAIASVDQYRDKYDPNNPAKNFMKTYEDIMNGDEVNFDGYAEAGAPNDVDLLIKFTDGTRAVSRFHRSCSDNDMNDIADCGKPQGNGKENSSSLLNTWKLRNLLGNGKQLGCTSQP